MKKLHYFLSFAQFDYVTFDLSVEFFDVKLFVDSKLLTILLVDSPPIADGVLYVPEFVGEGKCLVVANMIKSFQRSKSRNHGLEEVHAMLVQTLIQRHTMLIISYRQHIIHTVFQIA